MDPDLSRRWRGEAPAVWEQRQSRARGRFGEETAPPARPLVRPAPRSAMFFPLVVLVAVLPGLVALNAWDLTPPGPMWGLRGLAVLDGLIVDQVPAGVGIKTIREEAAYKAVAFQPPLYAWLESVGFRLSADRNPMASVLPSYVAGALAVVLVYLHGRLWRGAGLGLTAAILVGFNQSLLLRMQEATPTTLAVCGVLAALLAYGWHERVTAESASPWSWGGPIMCSVLGGLALGLALLSLGGLALIAVPIVAMHQYYQNGVWPRAQARPWSLNRSDSPGLVDGLLALTIALGVALPWFVAMFRVYGWQALLALRTPPDGFDNRFSLLPRLIDLTPVAVPMGLYGAVRAIRSALVDEVNAPESVGGSFWVIWLAVAALAPALWPSGPQGAFDLILLVALSLLAAQTIADLVNRRISVRGLIGLAPATAMSVAWWVSADLRRAVDDLFHGRADAATALGLHLALDLIVASVWIIRAMNRWARRRDDRQRFILAVFLLAILAITLVDGFLEVLFRHKTTHDLLSLRTVILRHHRDSPFTVVAVVSPNPGMPARAGAGPIAEGPSPGGRLRFILKTALPRLPQRDLNAIDELLNLPEGERLIILSGIEQRLSSAEQAKLGVEAIHPGYSGILDAYATARVRLPRR